MNRRAPAVAVTAVVASLLVWQTSGEPAPATPVVFSTGDRAWIPQTPAGGVLESVWYCPGVPAGGREDALEVGGAIAIANPSSEATRAQITFVSDTAPSEQQVIDLAANGRALIDVDSEIEATFAGAVVEILGGGGAVEQRVFHPDGNSSTPCTTDLSSTWYLADGYTVGEALHEVILMNPADDQVVVDVEFLTDDGVRRPSAYTGYPVPARSTRIIDVGAEGAGARGETRVGVIVTAARGALLVGRAASADDDARGGTTVSSVAAVTAEQWWFAAGDKGSDATERYSIMNPGETDAEVSVVFFPREIVRGPVVVPVTVPARRVATIDTGTVSGLPEGAHGAVVSTTDGSEIVVDRALTRIADGQRVTSVVPGVPNRPDGDLPTSWLLAGGPSTPTPAGLSILNVDNEPVTVTITVLGATGEVPLPKLEAIEIPGTGLATPDLVDEAALARPLRITATGRVLVERSIPSGTTSHTSWAIAGADQP